MQTNGSIFITGGAGFIGSHIARRLVREKFDVHVLVKPSTNFWRLRDVASSITLHHADITERKVLTKLFHKINPMVIFHCAASGAYAGKSDTFEMITVNIAGTVGLIEASLDIPYKLFIHIGSSAESGMQTKARKETDVVHPMSIHTATKAAGTLLAQTYARLYKKPIVVFRPFTVYGPYEETFRFIPTAIGAVLKQKNIQIPSETVRHDYVYIDDFTDACMKAMNKADSLSGEICNIGTGNEYTNDEVLAIIFKIAGKRTKVIRGGYQKRTWDSPHWLADTSHTAKILGWRARTTLAQGLKKTYMWFAAHRDLYADR